MWWASAIWQQNSLRVAPDLAVVFAWSEYVAACANLPDLVSVQP